MYSRAKKWVNTYLLLPIKTRYEYFKHIFVVGRSEEGRKDNSKSVITNRLHAVERIAPHSHF